MSKAGDALLDLVTSDPERCRALVVESLEHAENFSPDLRAQIAEWAPDDTSLDLILAAFSALAGGFIAGYETAQSDTA